MEQYRLRAVQDVSVGAWVAPRLGPFGGRVGSVAPRGFDAYARLLHPAEDERGRRATWSDVCAAKGRHAHALMQWRAIAGVEETTAGRVVRQNMLWQGQEPEEGNLDATSLSALCGVLAGHTPQDARCFFALWDSYGWIHGGSAVATLTSVRTPSWFERFGCGRSADVRREEAPPGLPEDVVNGPRLRHPGRDYILFEGPLDAVTTLGRQVTDDWFIPQSPNLFWPEDQSWCVATEIDYDSSIVAGTPELVAAVMAEPTLETWRVDPDDSLMYDGDTVNT